MPDYEEVMEARANDHTRHVVGPSPQALAAILHESHRAATVLTELLDSPAWNVFRSNIAGSLQAAEAERALLRDKIEGGALVGDDRARADLRLQYLRGLIEAYTLALELPKQLVAQHEKLETFVSEHPSPVETTEIP